MWDCYATPQVKVMQFLFVGSFAGNSSFKAVLAASSVLSTAHYRRVVPAHNTPNKVSRELQQIWRGDYALLHINAVVGNSLQPFFSVCGFER